MIVPNSIKLWGWILSKQSETILAIESSCDETAVAIIRGDKAIVSHIVLSQLEEHQPYGGVVPEIASRAHIAHLQDLVEQVMKEANLAYSDLDAVAVTAGPGLIGGVIVGVMVAKGIASAASIPLIGVNHLEGHALTVRLTSDIEFPFLLLLVSGGHCQFLSVSGVGQYRKLGGTIDDALGEAYDKVAKMLGLDYPGGPIVEKYALDGNENRFVFPQPLKGRPGCDFSFSGLKTAVKREVDGLKTLSEQDKADVCASFQRTVGDVVVERLARAMTMYESDHTSKQCVLAGGVAANQYIRKRLDEVLVMRDYTLYVPPIKLCTDNAAMIGWAGIERLRLGKTDELDLVPKARWSLEDL